MTIGKKLSPILYDIETMIIDHEAYEGTPHEFTHEGFRAALKIFMAALLDKLWKLQEEERIPYEHRYDMAREAGNKMREFVRIYTGIDTTKLYDK